MSITTDARSAILGSPLDPSKKPSGVALVGVFGDIEIAIEGAAAGEVRAETWTALAAIVGTRAGQPAYISGTSGTHTDPVSGETLVNNNGAYRWSVSPAGWLRIGDYTAAALETEVDGIATEVNDARQGEASVAANLTAMKSVSTALDSEIAAHNTEIVAARDVFASVDDRLSDIRGDLDVAATAATDAQAEVVGARGGFAGLVDNVDDIRTIAETAESTNAVQDTEIAAARQGEASVAANLTAIKNTATSIGAEVTAGRDGAASLAAAIQAIKTAAAALGTEVTAGREGAASLLANLTLIRGLIADLDTATGGVALEVTNGREGAASLLANLTAIRGLITTVTNEVVAGRDGAASLLAAIEAIKAETAAMELADAAFISGARTRPGETAALFSTALTGSAASRSPIDIGEAVVSDYFGAAWQIDGADIAELGGTGFVDVALRMDCVIEAGHKYEIRYGIERAVNPADPLNEAVELRLQNLTKNKALISNVRFGETAGDGVVVAGGDAYALTVAGGPLEVSVIIAREAADDVDYVVPATTRYVTVHARIYGDTGLTNVAYVAFEDISKTRTIEGEVGGIAADLAAEESARIAADSAEASARTAADAANDTAISAVAAALDTAEATLSLFPLETMPAGLPARSLAFYDQEGSIAFAIMDNGIPELAGVPSPFRNLPDGDGTAALTFYDQADAVAFEIQADGRLGGYEFELLWDAIGGGGGEAAGAGVDSFNVPLAYTKPYNPGAGARETIYLVDGIAETRLTDGLFDAFDPDVRATFVAYRSDREGGMKQFRVALDDTTHISAGNGIVDHFVWYGQSQTVEGGIYTGVGGYVGSLQSGPVAERHALMFYHIHPNWAAPYAGAASYLAAVPEERLGLFIDLEPAGSTIKDHQAFGFARRWHAVDGDAVTLQTATGVGGYSVAELAEGTVPFENTMDCVRAGMAQAARVGMGYQATVLINHGEDNRNDEDYGSILKSQMLDPLKAAIMEASGQADVLFFMTQMANWISFGDASCPGPQEQLRIDDENANIVMAMPTYHIPHEGFNSSETVHWAAYDKNLVGEKLAQKAALGEIGGCLRPAVITASGTTITVTFANRFGVLQFKENVAGSDPNGVTPITNRGFELVDVNATIVSVAFASSNTTVAITVSQALTAGARLRYAFTGTPGADPGPVTGPRGTVCDSDTQDPSAALVQGRLDRGQSAGQSTDPLVNWLCVFDKTITL